VRSTTAAQAQRYRLPAWAVAEGPFGIRLLDVGIVHLVILAIEVNVIVGNGPGAVPLTLSAHLLGAALALPILFRHRWPFQVMIATAVLIFFYYIFARRNISPAPLFFVPLYDAAVAGYLIWAIAIAAGFMITGLFVVELSTREGLATLASDFLSQIVILALAVTLGEVVRGRRALTAETATRLQLAEEERAAEAARLVAEERLHIARELHDTVAHSMATITVQAGTALHLLGPAGTIMDPNGPAPSSPRPGHGHGADADLLRAALTAIRNTSKGALTEMSSVLGQLRRSGHQEPSAPDDAMGLSRLGALRDAVTAAGAAVTVTMEGEPWPLSADADHSAYRILQESLTNVLRHAGPGAAAQVCLRYQPDALTLTVTDNGPARASDPRDGLGTVGHGTGGHATGGHGAGGHGLRGMRERAAAAGGELTAGPLPDGGFRVTARLPAASPYLTAAPDPSATPDSSAALGAAPAPGTTPAPGTVPAPGTAPAPDPSVAPGTAPAAAARGETS
jgi:signal transduction histidine kinase